MDDIRTNPPAGASHAGNDSRDDHDGAGGVDALFRIQARRTPHAVALEHGERRLSYAELDACAERLAQRLRNLGIGADDCVAVCAQRGLAPVVAMLAALKAGAAYLPLDPDYPRARLQLLLADAAPAARLLDAAGRRALGLRGDDDRRDIDLDDCDRPDPAIATAFESSDDPQRLAYVIYTSGSTGTPKGVAMPHAPLLNLLRWQRGQFGDGQRVLQFAALGFDVAFQEIFGALCFGSTLVVAEPELRRDFAALARALAQRRIARLHLPCLALSALADALAEADAATVAGLRAHLAEVVVAGEQLRLTAPIRAMFARLPQCRLHNHYGPTETHVVAAHVLAAHEVAQAPAHVPIGRAVDGARLYLLDAQRQPVADGDAGELWIGGAAPARGYLGRAELSAQRFPADPFVAGARMYRSGDRVRRLPGGDLEFLGRDDDQVKIRGHRVEPDEVAAQLAEHPRVREAAMVARAGAGGALELIAYAAPVAGDGGDAADFAAALREHLRQRLPEPLRPAAIVALAALPRSAHGKLDRAALPAPDAAAYGQRDYRAPRPGAETELAQHWQALLGRERIGRDDDFFALGGHSLSAARLLAALRRHWRVELPVSAIWNHPTLAAQAAALAALRADAAAASEPPRAGEGEAVGALSSTQRRLWFLSQFEGLGAAYHIPLLLRLRGALDTAALRRALDALCARHAGLRARFVAVDGEPRLQPLPAGTAFAWRESALDFGAAADSAGALHAALQEEACRAFDLQREAPARAWLARTGTDEFHLLVTLHHLVADGESLAPLLRDLAALYAAFAAGTAEPLAPLPWQFSDYAAWQQRRRGDDSAALDYWRRTLAGAPALLELPTRAARPPQQDFAGTMLPLRVEADLTEALRRRARSAGTSLFALVLAAWATVLSRLSGQDEVVIGAPSAQRGLAGSEDAVGFFVDTLALRIDLSGDPDIERLIERARRCALDAQDHALPFERVVEALRPPRRADRTPLFQAVLAWQGEAAAAPAWPGVDAKTLELILPGAKFDLELQLGERDGALVGGLRYASALFDPAAIQRHCGYLLAALRAFADGADGPVAAIDLLDADERRLQLHDWNRTAADYPREACFHHLFERQARRTPQATALESAGATLSYAALDAAADRLAGRLIGAGVGPERRVALCAQRGFDAIVAILAVLKAGGAYVPLDPAHVRERSARVLADAAPVCLLADAEGRRALAAAGLDAHWPTLALDGAALDVADDAHGEGAAAPARAEVGPQHLAYIVYTSGSTGEPKGAMIEHRNLVQFAHSQAERFGIGAHSRIAQFASLSFDASLIEIGLSLSRGGALCIPGADERADAGAYLQWIARERIGLSYLPPAFLQGRDTLAPFATSPLLLVGGEAVPPGVLSALQRGGARPVHVYGPTETTVLATAWEPPPHWPGDAPAPIGRPLANTRAYVLDAQRRPLPLGAPGELYLGGAGVARGYLGRDALSAERFFADPFDPAPGARMYRSGDRVRYREDGELMFLGRDDGQVKLRGYRIELGEIEARLREHPDVREAVVALREDEPGRKRLVAYVVADLATGGSDGFAAALRAHLAARLPDYMLPAACVRLDALPLNANGKLDRRALPPPDGADFARRAYAPPHGELEILLAQWWQELLQTDAVGRDDDFFELGGHSLLAMRLLARLREELEVAVAPSLLFRRPRLAGFAEAVLAVALREHPLGAAS